MDDNDDDKPGGGTLVISPRGPDSAPDSTGHGTTVMPVVGPRDRFAPLVTAETELSMRALPSLKSTEPLGFAIRPASHPSGPFGHPAAPEAPDYDWSQSQSGPRPAPPPTQHFGAPPPWNGHAVDHMPAPASAVGSKRGLVAMAIGAFGAIAVMVSLVVIVLVTRAPAEPQGSAVASSSSIAVAAPPPAETAPKPAPSAITSAAAPIGPDAEAIAGLERLRDGIALCVKDNIHRLPGTSPPVPATLAWLKSGPYKSSRRDWETPVFHCTKTKFDQPMPFMIQWQVDVPGKKGTGIAWLDSNGDGTVERAYAFTGTLMENAAMQFGPIEQVDPTRKPKRQ